MTEASNTHGKKTADNVVFESRLLFENSKWLRTEEIAEYLRTSPAQIRNWAYQGKLKAYKIGRSLRFNREEIDLRLKEGGQLWE